MLQAVIPYNDTRTCGSAKLANQKTSFVIAGLGQHQDDVERRKECAGDLHAPGHDLHRNPQRLDPLDPTVLGAHLGTVDDRDIPRIFFVVTSHV